MVDAPCSRIGHIYRKFAPFPNPGVGDFVGREFELTWHKDIRPKKRTVCLMYQRRLGKPLLFYLTVMEWEEIRDLNTTLKHSNFSIQSVGNV